MLSYFILRQSFTFNILVGGIALCCALSIDAFAASFSYGVSKIKIPFLSAVIIAIVSSLVLLGSLVLGNFIFSYISADFTKGICFTLLLVMGILKLLDSIVKRYIRKHQSLEKNIKFNFLSLHFILKIYADPEIADNDRSKILSTKESIALSAALSLDNLAVGIGAGYNKNAFIIVTALSLVCNLTAIYVGGFLGRKIAAKLSLNLAWISGVVLIVLAATKLF